MRKKDICTREDILREQEILKHEPDMMNDVKHWVITHKEWKEWKSKHKQIKQEQKINKRQLEKTQQETQKIRCVETGEVYKNVKDVQKKTGLGCKIVWKACKDNLSSLVGGYHWEFVE